MVSHRLRVVRRFVSLTRRVLDSFSRCIAEFSSRTRSLRRYAGTGQRSAGRGKPALRLFFFPDWLRNYWNPSIKADLIFLDEKAAGHVSAHHLRLAAGRRQPRPSTAHAQARPSYENGIIRTAL